MLLAPGMLAGYKACRIPHRNRSWLLSPIISPLLFCSNIFWDGGTQFPAGDVDLVTFLVAVAIRVCVAGDGSLVASCGRHGGAVDLCYASHFLDYSLGFAEYLRQPIFRCSSHQIFGPRGYSWQRRVSSVR